jgi:hypothetical protein
MRNTNIQTETIFASAARTATPTPATISCGSLGGLFVIHVTAVTATPSVVFNIDGTSGDTSWTIIDSAAITATGTTIIRVHPSLTGAANTIAKDILPSSIMVTPVHGDTDSITYSMEFIGVN